jgi:hypothetical protein
MTNNYGGLRRNAPYLPLNRAQTGMSMLQSAAHEDIRPPALSRQNSSRRSGIPGSATTQQLRRFAACHGVGFEAGRNAPYLPLNRAQARMLMLHRLFCILYSYELLICKVYYIIFVVFKALCVFDNLFYYFKDFSV